MWMPLNTIFAIHGVLGAHCTAPRPTYSPSPSSHFPFDNECIFLIFCTSNFLYNFEYSIHHYTLLTIRHSCARARRRWKIKNKKMLATNEVSFVAHIYGTFLFIICYVVWTMKISIGSNSKSVTNVFLLIISPVWFRYVGKSIKFKNKNTKSLEIWSQWMLEDAEAQLSLSSAHHSWPLFVWPSRIFRRDALTL